jgi:hypothetical protein
LRFRQAGKVRTLQRSGTGPLVEARKALRELRDEAEKLQAGSLKIRTAKISTFGEALDHYTANLDPRQRAKSYFDRMKSELGNVSLGELRERFKAWLLSLRHTVTDAAVNRFYAWGRAALGGCVEDELIDANPLVELFTKQQRKSLRETPRDVTLSDLDRKRLLGVVEREAPHLLPLVTFASLVPTRKGELVNLPHEKRRRPLCPHPLGNA